jgi:N4-gp56 family major capsid protein
MLARGLPYLHHGRVAQRRPMPSNSGTTAAFRRLNALALQTVPLVEGVVPTGKQLSKSDMLSILKQYGDYLTLTDYFELTVESQVLADASRVLGEQSGQSIDAILRDAFAAGTSVFYGGNAANRAALTTTTHKVDGSILRRMIRYLRSKNARPFNRIIDATDHVDTKPVRESYWAITTPEVHYTLNVLSGWQPLANYAETDGALPGEVGAFEDLRFLVSSQAKSYAGGGGAAVGDVKSTSGNADVHTILVFGQDAVGIVPLDGNSFENIIHPRATGGPSNPMNQYGTMAWKRTGTQLILNDDFMTRAEVTVADVTP